MRLFAGLPIPVDLAKTLARLARAIDIPSARWLPPENIHLTLVFLGQVTEDRFPPILKELDELKPEPIEIGLTHLDTFPRAGILFADVVPTPALLSLQAEVASRMARCGFPLDQRPYHPHVTLARFRSPTRNNNWTALPSAVQRSFLAEAVNLYRSYTDPTGARYEVLGQSNPAKRSAKRVSTPENRLSRSFEAE
jgi:2'-5' RNA ligase